LEVVAKERVSSNLFRPAAEDFDPFEDSFRGNLVGKKFGPALIAVEQHHSTLRPT
jgi:hypothetical protein